MKIVYKPGTAEIIEKKSRFIADIAYVKTEDEANDFIAQIKKRLWDCRHNCSAFVLGENAAFTRCSDDGEPSGTAGRPILDAILGADVTNVCVVVSRYFGGTLLGTGGLVRAYGQAAKEGLNSCTLCERLTGSELTIEISYDLVGKVQYLAAAEGLFETGSDFSEKVKLSYMIPADRLDYIINKFTELSCGKALLTVKDPVNYIVADGKIILI